MTTFIACQNGPTIHFSLSQNYPNRIHIVSMKFYSLSKLYIPSTTYKHLIKGAHQSHLGGQKMGCFLADLPVQQVKLKFIGLFYPKNLKNENNNP